MLLFLLLPICAIGIIGFEFIWRTRVIGGHEAQDIALAIRSNDAVKRVVGDVISTDFVRLGSKADFGLFGSEDRGRYRYIVKGTKTRMDVLVTWHAKSRKSDVIVDKIESMENWQTETIWTRRVGVP
jgi:hypothetical protein